MVVKNGIKQIRMLSILGVFVLHSACGEAVIGKPRSLIGNSNEVKHNSNEFDGANLLIKLEKETFQIYGEPTKIYKNKLVKLEPRGRMSQSLSPTGKSIYASHKFTNEYPVNDIDYPSQWGLNNIGQRVDNHSGVLGAGIGVESAWKLSTGLSDGVVAVFGHKVDNSHEDLLDSIWVNAAEIPSNGVDDDNNGYIDDVYGVNVILNNGNVVGKTISETTGIAGIISAKRNNAIGVSGVTANDKVLTCNLFEEGYVTTRSDIADCFEYVIKQKSEGMQNIHSVILPWGISGTNPEDVEWLKDLIESLVPYDIFVIAPVRMSDDFSIKSLDFYPEFPASFDLPNLISITAQTNRNLILGDAGVGNRTVHTAAPGKSIVTTTPGQQSIFTESNSLFFESFEDAELIQWQQVDAAYNVTSDTAFTGQNALQITGLGSGSPTSDKMISKELDLSNFKGRELAISYAVFSNEENVDWRGISPVFVDISFNSKSTSSVLIDDTLAPNWRRFSDTFIVPSELSDEDLKHVTLTFSPMNVSYWSQKLYLDDFAVGVVEDTQVSNRYDYFHGTSAAAAYLAGSLSIIKATRPDLSMTDIKNLLISSGTELTTHYGQVEESPSIYTIGGRSLKLSDEQNNSVLTCKDQKVIRRISPKWSGYTAIVGEQIDISVLNINCAKAEDKTLIKYNGRELSLNDDGTGIDKIVNDGVFSGEYSFDKPGDYTVEIVGPHTKEIKHRVFSPYQKPIEIPFEWEDSSAAEREIGIKLPFPINIGNVKDNFDRPDLGINFFANYGYLSISTRAAWSGYGKPHYPNDGVALHKNADSSYSLRSSKAAVRIPVSNANYSVFIASHWGESGASNGVSSDSGSFPFVVGTEPNRKFVIEYRDIRDVKCGENPLYNYQVVLNESSGEITMNYKTIGNVCNDYEPISGIQIGANHWVTYQGELRNNLSLKYKVVGENVVYINQRPQIIRRLEPLNLLKNRYTRIELDKYIVDDDMSTLKYSIKNTSEDEAISGIYMEGSDLIIETSEPSIFLLLVEAEDEHGLRIESQLHINLREESSHFNQGVGEVNLIAGLNHEIDLSQHFVSSNRSSLSYRIEGLESDSYVIKGNTLSLLFEEAGSYSFVIHANDEAHVYTSSDGVAIVEPSEIAAEEVHSGGGGAIFYIMLLLFGLNFKNYARYRT